MKFITSIFTFLVFAAALVFALYNRQSVSVSLWPFDVQVTTPLFILSLGTLALGILIGGLVIWVGTLRHKLAARRLGKDVVILTDKIQEMERELLQYRAREGKTLPMLAGRKWRFWERFKRDKS